MLALANRSVTLLSEIKANFLSCLLSNLPAMCASGVHECRRKHWGVLVLCLFEQLVVLFFFSL